jgi:hypothetical protein
VNGGWVFPAPGGRLSPRERQVAVLDHMGFLAPFSIVGNGSRKWTNEKLGLDGFGGFGALG